MKYVILIGDGMGDHPVDELGGRTILEAAYIPNMDELAKNGRIGRAQTIPEDKQPGSDVANMAIMGYDPSVYHTGRGPLEAASMGVTPAPNELCFRLNLVSLDLTAEGRVIVLDHAGGYINTREGGILIEELSRKLPLDKGQKLYPGVGFRHLLTWPDLPDGLPTIAPHDYKGQDVSWYFETADPALREITELIRASWPILEGHPIGQAQKEAGHHPANSIWPWGQGRPPAMTRYRERFGVGGAVVSAVDLIKGLGVYAGLDPLEVERATGLVDTNFEGKVAAALKALETDDFVLVHIEAPDEAGHQGDAALKKKAVELFDERVVGPMKAALDKMGDYRLLVLCDHYTPVDIMTHSREPVPFILYPSPEPSGRVYSEAEAEASGLFIPQGYNLVDLLFGDD